MKIYIWKVQFQSPERFRGLSVLYRDHQKGSGGPPGGSTYPGGAVGCSCVGTSPKWAGAPHQGPKAPRAEGASAPPGGMCPSPGGHRPQGPRPLGLETLVPRGQVPHRGKPPPPSRWVLGFGLPPINREGVGGQQYDFPHAALPLSHLSSSSVALGEALPENH